MCMCLCTLGLLVMSATVYRMPVTSLLQSLERPRAHAASAKPKMKPDMFQNFPDFTTVHILHEEYLPVIECCNILTAKCVQTPNNWGQEVWFAAK